MFMGTRYIGIERLNILEIVKTNTNKWIAENYLTYQVLLFICVDYGVTLFRLIFVCFLFAFCYLTRDYFSFRCSLGDVTNNDDHYKKALEVSNNKSARAMVKLLFNSF